MDYDTKKEDKLSELEAIRKFILENSDNGYITIDIERKTAHQFNITFCDVEEIAFEMNLLPLRYLRNGKTITAEMQQRLFRSNVAVVGCGGLGGYVVEELARLGVGHITVIDPDVFQEHNLNRQLLSSIGTLGMAKVKIAKTRVKEINPAVTLKPVRDSFSKENGIHLLKGANIVIDALDNIPARLELSRICRELAVPLIHGAIGGWYGQIAVQTGDDEFLQEIYSGISHSHGVEKELGNPSFTPGVIASIQAALVCRLILSSDEIQNRQLLTINLYDLDFSAISFGVSNTIKKD